MAATFLSLKIWSHPLLFLLLVGELLDVKASRLHNMADNQKERISHKDQIFNEKLLNVNWSAIFSPIDKKDIKNLLEDKEYDNLSFSYNNSQKLLQESIVDLKNLFTNLNKNKNFANKILSILRTKILKTVDIYIPRQTLFKLANLASSYYHGNTESFCLSNVEREKLKGTIDLLQRELKIFVNRKGPLMLAIFDFLKKTNPVDLTSKSLVYLTATLKSYGYKPEDNDIDDTTKDDENNYELYRSFGTSRQIPFGIVNSVIRFLRDPIVLSLLIAFNLWFVIVGLYSFFFGSTVLFFPNLFGDGGGGGGGGGGTPVVTGGLVGPPARPAPQRPRPPIRPQQVAQITTAIETSPYPDKTTPSTTTSLKPQKDEQTSTTPNFILHDSIPIYSILHACLSLGGKKPECKLQALNFSKFLKKPITDELLESYFTTTPRPVKPFKHYYTSKPFIPPTTEGWPQIILPYPNPTLHIIHTKFPPSTHSPTTELYDSELPNPMFTTYLPPPYSSFTSSLTPTTTTTKNGKPTNKVSHKPTTDKIKDLAALIAELHPHAIVVPNYSTNEKPHRPSHKKKKSSAKKG